MQKLPVLITFFNRPAILEQLFVAISKRNDIQIFFSCDGPRNEIDKSNGPQFCGPFLHTDQANSFKSFGKLTADQTALQLWQ